MTCRSRGCCKGGAVVEDECSACYWRLGVRDQLWEAALCYVLGGLCIQYRRFILREIKEFKECLLFDLEIL